MKKHQFISWFLLLITVLALGRTSLGQVSPSTPSLSLYTPTLLWCPVDNAVAFNVYMGNQPGQYLPPTRTNNSLPFYTVDGLAPGTYYFAVSGIGQDGTEGEKSNEITITIAPPPLPSPSISNILLPSITTRNATITWVTSEDCDGQAFWSTDKINWLSFYSNHLGTTYHLVVASSLVSRTHYYFKVQSVCGGQTLESSVESFNTK